MKELLDFAIATAKRAGDITLEYFGRRPQVEWKIDRTPVTQADKACEEKIIASIQKDYPDHAILGEEFGTFEGQSDFKWIIDPIDGTKNFIRGIPMYGTLIGLEKAGECVLGVAYSPALNDLVYAAKGNGCFANGNRVNISEIGSLGEALMLYGSFKAFDDRGWRDLFFWFAERTIDQRGYGDYYGYTLIARGCSEFMLEAAVSPWDLAAIKIIVEEAGGRFTNFDGESTIYSPTAVASNGLMHDIILDVIDKFKSDESLKTNVKREV